MKGVVTDNNNVWIQRSSGLCPFSIPTSQTEKNNPNLCLVGTDAMTAGRQNISGSTASSSGGVTFYKRPPSVSFASSSLPAFVVMNNGRFQFAIIASCGNPVVATPIVPPAAKPQTKPTPTPTPNQPAAPAPAQPSINITNTNTNVQSQSQSQAQGGSGGGTIQTPQPAAASAQAATPQTESVAQASAPVVAAAPVQTQTEVGKTLPNTGPTDVFAIGGLTTVFSTIGRLMYVRRKV